GSICNPFPADNALLELLRLERPQIFYAIEWTYTVMWFTTPYVATSVLLSLAYIFVIKLKHETRHGGLPPYPPARSRKELFLILGELHYPTKPEPAPNPRWLTIPKRGLYTGIAIFGATGSGKTRCSMHPFTEQILAFRHDDPERCIGGLV